MRWSHFSQRQHIAGRLCLAAALLALFISAEFNPILNTASAMNLSPALENLRWTKLPPLPDQHGFAGAFAGVSYG
jgi:acyl dehydratase